jgi:hypothetical protein
MPLLPTTNKVSSHILISGLTPYADEIIGDHRCVVRHNTSTTDQIFCVIQILEKKWEYNGTIHQLLIDFEKAYDSVGKEVLYSILIEFGIPLKLVRLIKVCSNEACSKVRIDKNLCGALSIQNGLKQEMIYRCRVSTLL